MSRYDNLKKNRSSNPPEEEDLLSTSRYQSIKANRGRRNYGVDDNFINTFIQDAQSFFTTSQEDINNLTWQSGTDKTKSQARNDALADLENRSATIRAYLNANKGKLSETTYSNLMSVIDQVDSGSKDIFHAFSSAENVFSKYNSEDDYQTALRYQGYAQKYAGMDGQEVMTALGSLEDGEEKDWLNINLYDVLKTADGFNSIASAGWNAYIEDRKQKDVDAQKVAEQATARPWYEKAWDIIQQSVLISSQTTDTTLINMNTVAEGHLANDALLRKPKDNWTDEHRLMYGYLREEIGEAGAASYAFYINNILNSEEEKKRVQQIKDWSTQNLGTGAIATAGAIAAAPYGLVDFVNDSMGYSTLGYAPGPDGFISPYEYSQAATDGISDKLNGVDEFGVAQNVLPEDIPVIGGKGWGDVYDLGVSVAQSYAYGKFGGLAGKAGAKAISMIAFFGPGAAAAWDDAVSRGATLEQAFLYSISMGAADAIAESIGIDNLMKIGPSATTKQFFWNLLKQGGAEGLEEGMTNILGNIADHVFMGDKSHFYLRVAKYQNDGVSEEDAKWRAWDEMWQEAAYDALGGFASGVVHAGPETLIHTHKQNNYVEKTYGSSQQELVAEALEINPNNAFAQKMQAKLDSGKQLSVGQLNRLVQQNEVALTAQDKSAIKSAAEAGTLEDQTTARAEGANRSGIPGIVVKEKSGTSKVYLPEGQPGGLPVADADFSAAEYGRAVQGGETVGNVANRQIDNDSGSGENVSTPTTRQALEQAIGNMDSRSMDPKTYNALFSYNNTLQHANTTQKLLDQKQDILQQQKASNASDAEIQRTQADIAKLEDILAQQEQKLSQAEEDPILQAAAEKASAEIVENRRKNDVDISRTFDRIKAERVVAQDTATQEQAVAEQHNVLTTEELLDRINEFIDVQSLHGYQEKALNAYNQQKQLISELESSRQTHPTPTDLDNQIAEAKEKLQRIERRQGIVSTVKQIKRQIFRKYTNSTIKRYQLRDDLQTWQSKLGKLHARLNTIIANGEENSSFHVSEIQDEIAKYEKLTTEGIDALEQAEITLADAKSQAASIIDPEDRSGLLFDDKNVVTVNGKHVILAGEAFDSSFVDNKGRSNLQRMKDGLSPYGFDGRPLNIHHLDQTDNGMVMVIPGSLHQKYDGMLHTNTGQTRSQIDRKAFGKWRNSYWKLVGQQFFQQMEDSYELSKP